MTNLRDQLEASEETAVSFSADEITTICKFLDWINPWLSESEGVVSYGDIGINVSTFESVSDWDSHNLETTTWPIPWLALTDPPAYDAEVKAFEKAEKVCKAAEEQERNRRNHAAREAHDIAEFERLKAKFG